MRPTPTRSKDEKKRQKLVGELRQLDRFLEQLDARAKQRKKE